MSEPESKPDYLAGLEGLQEDMANHQRRFSGSGEVTASANQALAAATMERLEKQDADHAVARSMSAPSQPERMVQRRSIDGREYTIDKAPAGQMYRTASEFESQVMAHAEPRIRLLLSKLDTGPFATPSWREKTLAAMYFKVKSLEAIKSGMPDEANVYERAFQQDLYELLESSNQSFGDWRKDVPSKLIVG